MNKELDDLEKYLFDEWKQNHVNFGCDYKLEAELDKQLNNLKSIKNHILKAQEQEKVLDVIKGKIIWVENDKLMCGRYADIEIELEEEDFENKEEFELVKRWVG